MINGYNGKGLLVLGTGLLFALAACNSADFGAGASSPMRSKSALTGKDGKGGNDGKDGNDASDGADGDAGSDGGGKDSGIDGGDGSGSGGIDGDGSGAGDGGNLGENDGGVNGGNDLGDPDEELTASNTGPLSITRTRKDQSFQMKIELMIKDVVKKTETRDPPGKGETISIDGMCRKGSKKTTTLRVTIMGKATWSTNGIIENNTANTSSCIYALRNSEKEMEVDVDPGGFGGSGGNCGYKEDDILTLSCPDSKRLELK